MKALTFESSPDAFEASAPDVRGATDGVGMDSALAWKQQAEPVPGPANTNIGEASHRVWLELCALRSVIDVASRLGGMRVLRAIERFEGALRAFDPRGRAADRAHFYFRAKDNFAVRDPSVRLGVMLSNAQCPACRSFLGWEIDDRVDELVAACCGGLYRAHLLSVLVRCDEEPDLEVAVERRRDLAIDEAIGEAVEVGR